MTDTIHTDAREIPRRPALVECGEGMQVEVHATRRRWAFGRWDCYIEPARGTGGRWIREANLEYLEPHHGGDDE